MPCDRCLVLHIHHRYMHSTLNLQPPIAQVCDGVKELSLALLAPVADAAAWLRNTDLLAAVSAKLARDASPGSSGGALSLSADDLVQVLITLHAQNMLPWGTAADLQPSSHLSKTKLRQRQQQQHLGEALLSALPRVLSSADASGRSVGTEGLMELHSRLQRGLSLASQLDAPNPEGAPGAVVQGGGPAAPIEAALKALFAACARRHSGPQLRLPPSYHAPGGLSGLYLRYDSLRQKYASNCRSGMEAGPSGDDGGAVRRLGRSVSVLQAYVEDGGCLPWALTLMADDLCSQLEGVWPPSA